MKSLIVYVTLVRNVRGVTTSHDWGGEYYLNQESAMARCEELNQDCAQLEFDEYFIYEEVIITLPITYP